MSGYRGPGRPRNLREARAALEHRVNGDDEYGRALKAMDPDLREEYITARAEDDLRNDGKLTSFLAYLARHPDSDGSSSAVVFD